MNPTETGKLIAKFRKEAGYTQVSLAKELNITDKAVSKWERGNSLPDSALLPKIAKLLDCDIEMLISGMSEYHEHEWSGLLIIDDGETSPETIIDDKPMIYYLLSYFMLVGITKIDIQVKHGSHEYIRNLHLERYGLDISFTRRSYSNLMIVYGKAFVFGVNLTRMFQKYMSMDVSIQPTVDGKDIPILFARHYSDVEMLKKISEKNKMGRGTVSFPMETAENIKDVSEFVRVYQKYHGIKIADIEEIAKNRALI